MRYTIKELDEATLRLLERFYGLESAKAMTGSMHFTRSRLLSSIAESAFTRKYEDEDTQYIREALITLNNNGSINWEKE